MLPDELNAPNARVEEAVSRLFAQYREAIPDPEPSPEFMPWLWEKVEARRSTTREWKRFARGFVTAAAAVSLLMGVFLAHHHSRQRSVFYTGTYLEILASHDGPGDAEILQNDGGSETF